MSKLHTLWPPISLGDGRHYLIALGLVLIAVVGEYLLWGLHRPPFPLMVPAVLWVAWQGRLGPTLLACLVGTQLIAYFFLEPIFSFSLAHPEDWPTVLIFIAITLAFHASARARQRMIEKLAATRTSFETFMRHLPACAFVKDQAGRYLFINDAILTRFKATANQWIGRTDFEILPAETAARIVEIDRKVLAEGQPMRVQETLPAPGGDAEWLTVKFPLPHPEGMRIAGVAFEITELRKTERALQESHDELARSNADLEQFAFIASHDLKEPLRTICNYAQLLERQYKPTLDEKGRFYMRTLYENSRYMYDLVDGLMEYSQAGRPVNVEEVDGNEILRRVVDSLQKSLAENGARLTQDPLPKVSADPRQLGQVFQNLIANALKYRSKRAPEIHVGATVTDGMAVFSVRDNGIGIEPRLQNRIFGLFQRLHRRDEYAGTGLGLSICKRIVERRGGRIWVESEAGNGATFFFTIPLAVPLEKQADRV